MSVKIKKGSVFVYRIFDIAEEINIAKAEACLQDIRGRDSFKVPRFIDRGIVVKSPPVGFGLGEVKIGLDGGERMAQVLGKVRDYGVLSLIYEIPLAPGTSWQELIELAADLEEGSEVDQIAQAQAKEVSALISSALKRPTDWQIFEDYIIYFIEEFEGNINARMLPASADVSALLLAEDDTKIATATRNSILENLYQYGEDDLAYVEWNSALVVEPKGGREVPDIIEFALTHLLEMRYYDDLLDQRLGALYDDIERSKGRLVRGKFSQISAEASSRYIEFSEFTERVENSLKVVGDFYLATVYRAANRRFRLSDWQQNITRKMNLLANVSNLLQGELNIRRSHWLEIIIIVLIGVEVLPVIFKMIF